MQTMMALWGTPAKALLPVRQRFGAGSNGCCGYLVGRDERDRAPCVERGVGLDKR